MVSSARLSKGEWFGDLIKDIDRVYLDIQSELLGSWGVEQLIQELIATNKDQ